MSAANVDVDAELHLFCEVIVTERVEASRTLRECGSEI